MYEALLNDENQKTCRATKLYQALDQWTNTRIQSL